MVGVLLPTLFLLTLLSALFLVVAYHRRRQFSAQLSMVSRQHEELLQGGQLNHSLLESTKRRFRDLLERGEVAAVEASLRPGIQYVVQVRALAEIGTEDAGRILERQVQRKLSDDELEQAWYWIDLAQSLRTLNRDESLPHLLRHAQVTDDIPLSHLFAVEMVSFLGFSGYVKATETPLGDAALRVLHKALEGVRRGYPAVLIAEARLGETVEQLWDHRPTEMSPLVVRVLAESLRVLRRGSNLSHGIIDERGEVESLEWQLSRLSVLEPALHEYLQKAPEPLLEIVQTGTEDEVRDALLALQDIRAETAPDLLYVLGEQDFPHPELAVETLRWSRNPKTKVWLCEWVRSAVHESKRHWLGLFRLSTSSKNLASLPYTAILRCFRGHPGIETEELLREALASRNPLHKVAALGSLGWWEPVKHKEVVECLRGARSEGHPFVRRAANAALARLGERHALQWFRQKLTGENVERVCEAIHVIATEGITLLWPELDRLLDSDNPDVVHITRVALHHLFEEMEQSTNV
ncbi:MAG: HEAT repeat domain-containing protein [Gemmataceae bacterium]